MKPVGYSLLALLVLLVHYSTISAGPSQWKNVQKYLQGKSLINRMPRRGSTIAKLIALGLIVGVPAYYFWNRWHGASKISPFSVQAKLEKYLPNSVATIVMEYAEEYRRTLVLEGTAPIYSVAFSVDSKWIVTGDARKASIWNVSNGSLRQILAEGRDITALVSPDRQTLATFEFGRAYSITMGTLGTTSRGGMQLWDINTGRHRKTLLYYSIYHATFSHDGKSMLVGGYPRGNTVMVVDANTGSSRYRWPYPYADTIVSAAFDARNSRILTASAAGTVRIREVATGNIHRQWEPDPGHAVRIAKFHPEDNTKVVTCGSKVHIWDVNSEPPKVLDTLANADNQESCALEFSPDGKQLVTGYKNGVVRIWDATDASLRQTLTDHTGAVNAIAFSRDAKQLVTGDADGKVYAYVLIRGTAVRGQHGSD